MALFIVLCNAKTKKAKKINKMIKRATEIGTVRGRTKEDAETFQKRKKSFITRCAVSDDSPFSSRFHAPRALESGDAAAQPYILSRNELRQR